MKLLTALRIYPKAMIWSIILSSCLIMEGYDTAVVGSCTCFALYLIYLTLASCPGGETV
jgi:MFS transporter, SP family, general alpha glucoside:H+ symporter